MPPAPSALILSTSRDRGALAAARSLKEAGWRVGVGTPDEGGMLAASSAVGRHHRIARPRGSAVSFIRTTAQAVRDGGYDVVFGSGDDFMAAASAYRDQIPATVPHPRWDVVSTALDKLELSRLAVECGLAVPETIAPAAGVPVAEWDSVPSLPAIVKCREHWAPGQLKPIRIEARLCHTEDEVVQYVRHIESFGARAIVQREVRGALGALIGIFHDGQLRDAVQQQTLRTWPTPNGASSRARVVETDPELLERSTLLLQRIGWSGLVELQFMTGPDGVPRLVDLNGRFYGSMSLAESARPGMVAAWAGLATGGAPAELTAARPRRYQWLIGDLRRALVERRGGLVRDLIDTLCASMCAVHSVISLRDPGPGLHLLAAQLPVVRRRWAALPIVPAVREAQSSAATEEAAGDARQLAELGCA